MWLALYKKERPGVMSTIGCGFGNDFPPVDEVSLDEPLRVDAERARPTPRATRSSLTSVVFESASRSRRSACKPNCPAPSLRLLGP